MKTGDKVKLTPKGLEGFPELEGKELVLIDHPPGHSDLFPFAVRWAEGEDGWGLFFHGEVEPASSVGKAEPEQDELALLKEENERLRAVVNDAKWTFEYFAELHKNKGTKEGIYKAMFNLMMADRLDDALKTDS